MDTQSIAVVKEDQASQKASLSQGTTGSVDSHKNPDIKPLSGFYGTGANTK